MADEKNTFAPGAMPPGGMPPFGAPADEGEEVELKDLLKQVNGNKWRFNGPAVMRGDIREAFKLAGKADKMECTCWNEHCPYHGDCRKCIVFHMALKQFPTCQRNMLTELYLMGVMDEELHIERDPATGEALPDPDYDEMFAKGEKPSYSQYFKK